MARNSSASQSMKVIDLIKKAAELGVQQTPYQETDVVAEGIEGKVETDNFNRKVLVLEDETGRKAIVIPPTAYTEGKTKYDIVVMTAERDFEVNGNAFKKGHKVLRAA